VDDVFIPTPQSPVRLLDQAVREDLALSLERIAERAAHVLPAGADTNSVAQSIRGHRIAPGVFAAYYELVYALQDKNWARAAGLWGVIAERAVAVAEPAVLAYEPVGEDADRFQRLFAMGWGEPCLFMPPEADEWTRFRLDAVAARGLLDAVDPAWRNEVDSLVTRVFAAVPPPGGERRFAGASSFLVWGAVFLNTRRSTGRLGVLARLVHEATHQMLFGLSRRQPLTENDPAARYPSPLRSDPRPMDGVYHATYVSGRLAVLYERLSRCNCVDAAERTAATEGSQRQLQRFGQGYAVLRADGKLSPLGRELIEGAAAGVADLPVV
jgi:HEXXH motif-containing protein